MPIKLPPGVSPGEFAAAIREFESVLGKEWVFTSEEDLDLYRDAYSMRWGHEDEYLASAAVAPDLVEQVQAIVRIANKYKIPLYPISTGKNLTYGGSAPSYSGSVVVDLKRMNRILQVDDKRNFALVEPGVSYFDLYRHIQEKGLKVWIDCPDPGWGSPIGNALDHGIGYTVASFRDHFGAHCGMEVVLPTGEVMRTGMGGLPKADTWQDYKYGVGPHVDGLFGQANFGIVTKMGFWLFPQPEAYMTGTITVPKYSDFGALVEQVNYFEDSQLASGRPLYGSPLQIATPRDEVQAMLAKGWPTIAQMDALAAQKKVPAWSVTLQIYGPEPVVRSTWQYVRDRVGKAIAGAGFDDGQVVNLPLKPEQYADSRLVNFGIPNMQIFASIARRPDDPANMADGHSDFFAVVPRTAEGCFKAMEVYYNVQRKMGISPITVTPFGRPTGWYHRAFFMGAPTVANFRDDTEKNRESRKLFEAYLTATLDAGFSPYRTNPGFHDQLVKAYSFNDNSLLRFQERLKDAADPNGIMAPGAVRDLAEAAEDAEMTNTHSAALAFALSCLTAGSALAAPDPEQLRDGKPLFDYWCASCHGPGLFEGRLLPGTLSLQNRFKGAKPAVLEERTDLAPAYTSFVVRKGWEGMPFFRKTEISDSQLAAIAAYLAPKTK